MSNVHDQAKASLGAARDALSTLHNLEHLLRSPRVGANILSALLPEVMVGCAALRTAFRTAGAVCPGLVEFASSRVDALEQALSGSGELEARARLSLEQAVMRVSGELIASVELLELIVRAASPSLSELLLGEFVHAALSAPASQAVVDPEVRVRVEVEGECPVTADWRVLSGLLALQLSRAYAHGAREVTLRVKSHAAEAHLAVEARTPAEDGAPSAIVARAPIRIPPADEVAAFVASSLGATLETDHAASCLRLRTARP